MDPALQEYLLCESSDTVIEAIVKLKNPAVVPDSLQVVARFDDIATCRLPVSNIREVWADEAVFSLKAPRYVVGELPAGEDVSFAGDMAAPSRQASDFTGKGVVVGVVDWGFDFTHPNFIDPLSGESRFLAIWDQTAPFHPSAGKYGYGRVYSQEEINRALRSDAPFETLGYYAAKSDADSTGSHAAHVSDIAAGNGSVGESGMAPEAWLLGVHLSAGNIEGLANLGDSVRLLEAIDFMDGMAGDRPLVINLSVGRHGGNHEGNSLVEQGMDNFLHKTPGRAIVNSAGNYFSENIHASGKILPGGQAVLHWEIDEGDLTTNELEVWYPQKDALLLEIIPPDEETPVLQLRLGEKKEINRGHQLVGRAYHRANDPNAGKNHINIFLYKSAGEGTWQIVLKSLDVVDGRFHAWVERDGGCKRCQSRLSPGDADPNFTTGSICNGYYTLAVGAYDQHHPDLIAAYFSSAGPTVDGRQKPNLLAPGNRIRAARSAPAGQLRSLGELAIKSGTSMAAPHLTGAIALVFEAAGRLLRIEETRSLVISSLAPPPSLPVREACRYGNGYLSLPSLLTSVTSLFPKQPAMKEHVSVNFYDQAEDSDNLVPSDDPVATPTPTEAIPFVAEASEPEDLPPPMPRDVLVTDQQKYLYDAILIQTKALPSSRKNLVPRFSKLSRNTLRGFSVVNKPRDGGPDYAVITYLAGENNLFVNAVEDMLEMTKGNIKEEIACLCLVDFSDNEGLFVVEIVKDPGIQDSRIRDRRVKVVEHWKVNKKNDLDAIMVFLSRALKTYKAITYKAIGLWGHGTQEYYKKIPDKVNFRDLLFLPDLNADGRGGELEIELHELKEGFDRVFWLNKWQPGKNQVDILFLDVCLLQTAEANSLFKPFAKIYMASENLVPSDGLDYKKWFLDTVSQKPATPTAWSKLALDAFIAYYGASTDNTFSAVETSKLPGLESSLSNFCSYFLSLDDAAFAAHLPHMEQAFNKATKFPYPHNSIYRECTVDLSSFMAWLNNLTATREVKNFTYDLTLQVANLVAVNVTSANMRNAKGLAIWFPKKGKLPAAILNDAGSRYPGIPLVKKTGWLRFCMRYLGLPVPAEDFWESEEDFEWSDPVWESEENPGEDMEASDVMEAFLPEPEVCAVCSTPETEVSLEKPYAGSYLPLLAGDKYIATRLFDALALGVQHGQAVALTDLFEVRCKPREQALNSPFQAGDVLISRSFGDGVAHAFLLANGQLMGKSEAMEAGYPMEDEKSGFFVEVHNSSALQGREQPHLRRIADENGWMLPQHLVFNPQPGNSGVSRENTDRESDFLNENARTCGAIVQGPDPTSGGRFQVGYTDLPIATSFSLVPGFQINTIMRVVYPADHAGRDQPFPRGLRTAPIVFMAHGNHAMYHHPVIRRDERGYDPGGFLPVNNHLGYTYFQEKLAQLGIISASIDCNTLNGPGFPSDNILKRTLFIWAAIEKAKSENVRAGSRLYQKINLDKTGLFGHSRGAEAVVAVPALLRVLNVAGVHISGVVSLAPTDTGLVPTVLNDIPLMAILPAADGDVSTNDGAKFYDRHQPTDFKSQLYIHGANHNHFNREWSHNPDPVVANPPLLSEAAHRQILMTYGSAFFRKTLLNESRWADILLGKKKPPHVSFADIQISGEKSPAHLLVDNFEDGNLSPNNLQGVNVATPSFGASFQQLNQSSSTLSAAGIANSFFGDTNGMIGQTTAAAGTMRIALTGQRDLRDKEIWIRAAEVFAMSLPASAAEFLLGLEDSAGVTAFVPVVQLGGLPRPFVRRDGLSKTMMKTFVFPVSCIHQQNRRLNLRQIVAIVIRHPQASTIVYDQIQVV